MKVGATPCTLRAKMGDFKASFDQKTAQLKSSVIKRTANLPRYFDRRLLSLGIFQAWLFLVIQGSAIIPFESDFYGLMFLLVFSFALLTLILNIFLKYRRRFRILLLIFGAVCGTLSTIGICYTPSESPFFVLELICLGLGIGIFLPFVGKVFSSVDIGVATRQVFLSFTFAVFLYFFLLGFPEVANTFVISLLPIFVALVILIPESSGHLTHHRSESASQDEVREIIQSRPIIIFFIGVGFLGFLFGFSLVFSSLSGLKSFYSVCRWSILIAGIGALTYFFIIRSEKRPFDFEKCFSPVVPIIVIGLLLFPYQPLISSTLIIVGFQLADMVIWIVFSWIASHPGLSQRVFCIGKGSMYVGALLGSFIAQLVPVTDDMKTVLMIVAPVLLFLLVLSTIFIFYNSKVAFAIKAYSSSSDLNYIAKAIELRCEELGHQYGLTMREREIFGYLAQGRSLPYIEAAMHISHGTANSHRDHIYLKTKIHSKQELLDLFFSAPKK